MTNRIHIIGVGSDGLAGLTARGRELARPRRTRRRVGQRPPALPEVDAERLRVGSDLPEVVERIAAAFGRQRVAVVASGDPLFYGVARYLVRPPRQGPVRGAAARQQHAAGLRPRQGDLGGGLPDQPVAPPARRRARPHPRRRDTVGLFTSEADDPAAVARELLARGLDYFRAYVCENLGGPDERVTQGELAEIADMKFDPLNVMILKRKPGRPDAPRPRQAAYAASATPTTSSPRAGPRAASSRRPRCGPSPWPSWPCNRGRWCGTWGPARGSVAIEAAQLSDPGTVFAIEQDAADYHLILANAETFGVRNLRAVHGTAPAVFAGCRRRTRSSSAATAARWPACSRRRARRCGPAAGWWSTSRRWRC